MFELRNALHEAGLFNLDLPHTDDFIPHMSINDGRPDSERTREILTDIKSKVKNGAFECSEIAYIVPDLTFHFEVGRTLTMG